MSRLHKFPLHSREQAANSPSRRDGVPEKMEDRRLRMTAQHMKAATAEHKTGITTWAIAVTFFNRFYTRKSMKKNNTFIVACASLFLAGKVNDQPVHHHKVANTMLKAWYNRENPQLQQLAEYAPGMDAQKVALLRQQRREQHLKAGLPPPKTPPPLTPAQQAAARSFWTDMYDAVLEAERALLYTVGFDFNIDIIHTHLARLLNRPRFDAIKLKENLTFQQYAINMANDIYGKDAMLVLEYPVEKIAIAVYYLIFKMAKATKSKDIPQPPTGRDGTPWYVEEGLSAAECADITTRLTARTYNGQNGGGKQQQQQPAGSKRPAASMGGAASTAVLGACESAAYSGGGITLPSDLGEHTSVARPLSSDLGSAFGSAAGTKRPAGAVDSRAASSTAVAAAAAAGAMAAAGGQGHPSKRARYDPAAAAGSQEDATSAAVHLPAADASPSPTGPVTDEQVAAPPSATAAGGAAAAAAAAEDSEKEEGELEEGEVR